jgi:hypothetical protein
MSNEIEQDTSRAKHLLVSYMQMLMEERGMRFDSDNVVEIEEIVDSIISAAVNTIATAAETNGRMTA